MSHLGILEGAIWELWGKHFPSDCPQGQEGWRKGQWPAGLLLPGHPELALKNVKESSGSLPATCLPKQRALL